jgi:DNA-binding NarL/FixJ family response regulator
VPKYTIAAIDDHPIVLNGIKHGLNKFPVSFKFLTFTDFSELFDEIKQTKINLLLTDLTMPNFNGITVIKGVKSINPQIKIAVFTQHDGEGYFKEAYKLGIDAYILKTESFLFLPEIFLRVLNGEFYVSPSINQYLQSTRNKGSLDNFEHEIIKMLIEGYSIREMSEKLKRSGKVIEYRLRKIKDYFDARNNIELVYKIRNEYFK